MTNLFEMVSLVVAILIPVGAMFKFFVSRLDKRFEVIDKRFESLEKKIDRIMEILQSMDKRIGRLENQEEERFRNEIKLIIKEREGK